MDYFEKLNMGIKNSLDNKKLLSKFEYFDDISKLAKGIIENTPNIERKPYYTHISISDSIKILTDFFTQLNPLYAEYFQNILYEKNVYEGKEDNTVRFVMRDVGSSFVRSDGLVQINCQEKISDIFTIGHEITHKFSQAKDQESVIDEFIGEVPSITMEFLLTDYLLENTSLPKEEILNYLNNRFFTTKEDALAVYVERILLSLYKQTGGMITKDTLLNYLNSLDKNSEIYSLLKEKGPECLNDIVNKGRFQFPIRQRYILGLILACEMHKQIKFAGKDMLFKLIQKLGDPYLNIKDLDFWNSAIINQGNIIIKENTIQELFNYYNEELENLTSQQENKL